MPTNTKSTKPWARVWGAGLLLSAILLFVLFWNSSLDLKVGSLFYHPENPSDPWFEQNHPLWLFFYHAAPWLTAIPLFGALFLWVISYFKSSFKSFRIYSVYIFLVIALGPGLLINSFFKPHWGRPRPREVQELGGKYLYHSFYQMDWNGQGKSFPCGHCSVGFSFLAFVLIWQRKSKKWTMAATIAGVSLGTFMGIGRMAAGGHFFSDVLWAGWVTMFCAYFLYYYILKIPEYEENSKDLSAGPRLPQWLAWSEDRNKKTWAALVLLSILTLASLLLATPFESKLLLSAENLKNDLAKFTTVESNSFETTKIQLLEVNIDQTNLDFYWEDSLPGPFEITGRVKGFGFPKNKVISFCKIQNPLSSSAEAALEIHCEISRVGIFSDYESTTALKVNPNLVHQVKLAVKSGDVFNRSTKEFDSRLILLEPSK